MAGAEELEWDYVVVGSGAGGATLTARLVEAGKHVFLIDAGGDPRVAVARGPDDYDVPAFHPFACENDSMSWNFHVRHYADEVRSHATRSTTRNVACSTRAQGRSAAAPRITRIFMLPHDSDWDDIASLTGDSSWRASRMRRYARDLETCYHRPVWRALRCPGIDWTGHGWDGWLRTEKSIPLDALGDADLRRVVRGTVRAFTPQPPRAAHECAALASRCRGSERTDVGAWQL